MAALLGPYKALTQAAPCPDSPPGGLMRFWAIYGPAIGQFEKILGPALTPLTGVLAQAVVVQGAVRAREYLARAGLDPVRAASQASNTMRADAYCRCLLMTWAWGNTSLGVYGPTHSHIIRRHGVGLAEQNSVADAN